MQLKAFDIFFRELTFIWQWNTDATWKNINAGCCLCQSLHVTRMFHVSLPSNATYLEKGHALKNSTAAKKSLHFQFWHSERCCVVCAMTWVKQCAKWKPIYANVSRRALRDLLRWPGNYTKTLLGGATNNWESPRWAARRRRPIAENEIYDIASAENLNNALHYICRCDRRDIMLPAVLHVAATGKN